MSQSTQQPVNWITVTSFPDPGTAHVAKLQLDDAEIPNYLDNEYSASTLWHIQPAVGNIRLRVPAEHIDVAREVLQRQPPPDIEAEPSNDEAGGMLTYASVARCPKCQSVDTELLSWRDRIVQSLVIVAIGAFAAFHPVFLLAVIAYAIYFLVTKPDRRCQRCLHRFSAQSLQPGPDQS